MDRFNLLGPLPEAGSTTVLEASAGTGKTFALAGLVTRYLAEGVATLDQMLLITFSRAASRELRERVRSQIFDAARAFDDSASADDNELVAHLLDGTPEVLEVRRRRLRDALAGFDAATIATTHEFCSLVLKSLGVAGDTAAGVRLVENIDELISEIVNDRYLAQFSQQEDQPQLGYSDALVLARAVVDDPCAQLRPLDGGPEAAVRLQFATGVVVELERRKRRRGILSYDDLLARLAKALEHEDSPARDRMRRRWPIVMVDEFQDTDPVQWQVIERAFGGRSTLILIGDPKQAIYAFRGGDIVTYLHAVDTADQSRTLGTNWRSDKVLVDALQTVLGGAALGDSEIVVRDVDAQYKGHRLAGAPHNDPFRLRIVNRSQFGRTGTDNIPIADLRRHITADLAADIGALRASEATFDGRELVAGDIAVLVEQHVDARACRDALAEAGIPVVYTGGQDVFASRGAADWLCLLNAFDQPYRSGLVRAAAATMFFGETQLDLAVSGDALTDRIAETLREWTDLARERGVAAVFEAAQLTGMGQRVLSRQGGERDMTDLAHLAQLLQDAAHRERLSLPALRDWLRHQCDERSGAAQRDRRLDSDAAAVQVMTVWGSKGLQYPIVYLPFAFNRYVRTDDVLLFHDDAGTRCLHIGGKKSPDRRAVEGLNRTEAARDNIRLTYVALTRAQSQVVAWWAPSRDEINGGLSRLLRGRGTGAADVPDRCTPRVSDEDALRSFRTWQDAGGPVIEESAVAAVATVPRVSPPTNLGARHFHRSIDTSWRRTSYSGLIRAVNQDPVSSEPEVDALDDEAGEIPVSVDAGVPGAQIVSPMSDLPSGATFGTLVHAVLETADPFAADLAGELERQILLHSAFWPVDVKAADLAAALVPMHDTRLGPLAGDLTLRQIGLADRLCELEFEIPLAGGDLAGSAPELSLSDVGELLRERLASDDPLAPYARRLLSAGLGQQSLRGYLSGSIDAVLRIGDGDRPRYLVVDYKTNRLGERGQPLTAADYSQPYLTEAMLHSDYPLQALLYTVVLHRFLRWRQPGYDPAQHLGGVLYLYVRGMCGADTPAINGRPAGVFSWQPSPTLVAALSDLLDQGRRVA